LAGDGLSSQIVAYLSIGAGVVAVLGGGAGWLSSQTEIRTLQRQQAQSKRMVIPPSVSDVERYAGATARLRVLHRRTRLFALAVGLGMLTAVAGGLGADRPRPATATIPRGLATAAPDAGSLTIDEAARARQLLASIGTLCRAERKRCKAHRRDVGPIVASICHFHPQLCNEGLLPTGLAPSQRDQAAAPRVPRPVLQALAAKVVTAPLAWSDIQLALP
jgi:hypothetical protein